MAGSFPATMDSMGPPPSALAFDRMHLRPGTRACVAVSGGADSVALLTALHASNALPRESLGVGLSAIHVHHGLRGLEADKDTAFVQALCKRLEVALWVEHVDVAAHAAAMKETTEEAARTLRYGCFEKLLADGKADAVLTAHTLDDQAETVLMKLLRGAWTEGLSGIYPVLTLKQGKIVRPLLNTRRAEVIGWLEARGQAWREDATNADPASTRNRLRHQVLPLLRMENPSLDRTLGNLAELAREEEARWEVELRRVLPQMLLPGKPVRGGGRAVSTVSGSRIVAIELERLRALDPAARRRVLRAAVRSLGTRGETRLSFDETARLLAFCGLRDDATAPARSGAVLRLGHSLSAERSVRELRLSFEGLGVEG